MSRTNSPIIVVTLAAVAILVSGCKKDIDKEHMDAVAAWSIAVCQCTTKACADALKKPEGSGNLASGNVYDTYTRQSLTTYDELRNTGVACEGKLK